MSDNNRMSSLEEVKAQWGKIVRQYQHPDHRSIVQILNTLIPFFILWGLMIAALQVALWLTLLLGIPTGLLAVRIFIIFHDCGHGSFFKSKKANTIVGFWMGVLTLTPAHHWWHSHAVHHASSGDLDRRGEGDVWTLTVDEYLALPRIKRIGYRIYRNPLVMFFISPMVLFFILQRIPSGGQRERMSVWQTNIALAGMAAVIIWLFGWQAYVFTIIPIYTVASIVGVWMFYVQHQFEDTYWARNENWDYVAAALHGSSFYKLPKWLEWFTGNIGYHHIHHLSPRIPNYRLPEAWQEQEIFQIEPITLWESFKAASYRLWDENREKLVGFNYVKVYRQKLKLAEAPVQIDNR